MHYDSMNKTVKKCFVVGKRRRGRPRKNLMDNIVEWVGSENDLTQLLRLYGTVTEREEFVLQRFIYPYDQPV